MQYDSRSEARIDAMIHRSYGPRQNIARANNEHLIDNIASWPHIYELLSQPEKMKLQLIEKLNTSKHTYRQGARYRETANGILDLPLRQLVHVYLLLEAFGYEEFNRRAGELLEEDLKDHTTEHGGLILFEERQLILHPLPSETVWSTKVAYCLLRDALQKPHIAIYHFHARTEDSSTYAGPSEGGSWFGRETSDLSICTLEAYLQGESHNLVITKLPGREFNADYYGAGVEWREKDYDPNDMIIPITVIDLGNYPY